MKPKLSTIIKKVQLDFSFLRKMIESGEIHSILLYGSYVKRVVTQRSDVDICIVAPNYKTPKEQARLLGYIWQNINANKYDVRIFESFPLYIKIDVIGNNEIIFTKNAPDLSYYFYSFRKLWNEQSVNWVER